MTTDNKSFYDNPTHMSRLHALKDYLQSQIISNLDRDDVPETTEKIKEFGNDLADKIVRFEAVVNFISREEQKKRVSDIIQRELYH